MYDWASIFIRTWTGGNPSLVGSTVYPLLLSLRKQHILLRQTHHFLDLGQYTTKIGSVVHGRVLSFQTWIIMITLISTLHLRLKKI